MKKKIAVLAALLLCGAFLSAQTIRATKVITDATISGDPGLDVRFMGAKCDGVHNDGPNVEAAATLALNAYPANKTLIFPAGTCILSGISHGSGVTYRGQGVLQTRLQHANGFAEPLIHVTGGVTGTPTPASPAYGYERLTLMGGNQTTALLYYDGRIDNNVMFENLQFSGTTTTTPATMDAISMKDYLNMHMRSVRWDGIGGWGINVRGQLDFASSSLSVTDFTYDNSTGSTAWGNGVLSVNGLTGPWATWKGPAEFLHGRIEINRPLNGAPPSRGMFRYSQDQTTWNGLFSAPLFELTLNDVTIDANGADSTDLNGKDMKVISVSAGDIAVHLKKFSVFGVTEIYGNDAGDQKYRINNDGWNNTTRVWDSSIPGSKGDGTTNNLEHHNGVNWFLTSSDGTNVNLNHLTRGDIVWNREALNDGGHHGRNFACKSVQTTNGFHGFTGITLSSTGSITSGTTTLQLAGAIQSFVIEGANLTVVGAGAAGADLQAVVTGLNFTTNTVTLNVAASTTVAAATVKFSTAQLFCVDMVQFANAAPTSTAYQQGDKVINYAPAPCGSIGWVNTTAGTPGTFQQFGMIGTGGASANPWASPCAIGATTPQPITGTAVTATTSLTSSGTATLNAHIASGTALGHGTVAGCATGATVGATCTVNVAWGVALADSSYRAVCGGRLVTSGIPVNGAITAQSTTAVTFQTVAATAAAAQFTNIDCIAIHP